MKCIHPHCFATIDPGSALYLSLETIDESLGRPAKISDLKYFAVHALHGYGSTREYLEHMITIRQNATPAPETKITTVALKDRVFALNVKYGLSPTELDLAVNQHRTEGTDLGLAMKRIADLKALIAQLGLTDQEVVSARLKAMAEYISIADAMKRIAIGKRLHAAKQAKKSVANPVAA